MTCYAVVDTNVLVSGLLASNSNSPTVKVLESIFDRVTVPILTEAILREYHEVLLRPKFKFNPDMVNTFLQAIELAGMKIYSQSSGIILDDMKDLSFYEGFSFV